MSTKPLDDRWDPELCPMCGRRVARKAHKLRHRHKCPHGLWCAQGRVTWGSHSNGRPPPEQQKCCGTHGAMQSQLRKQRNP